MSKIETGLRTHLTYEAITDSHRISSGRSRLHPRAAGRRVPAVDEHRTATRSSGLSAPSARMNSDRTSTGICWQATGTGRLLKTRSVRARLAPQTGDGGRIAGVDEPGLSGGDTVGLASTLLRARHECIKLAQMMSQSQSAGAACLATRTGIPTVSAAAAAAPLGPVTGDQYGERPNPNVG